MALFGSVLREDFQADSDIDILVKFAPKTRQGLLTLAKIKHELETRFGRSNNLSKKVKIGFVALKFFRQHKLFMSRSLKDLPRKLL